MITSFWTFRLFAAGVFGCVVFELSGMNLISYSDPKSVSGSTQWDRVQCVDVAVSGFGCFLVFRSALLNAFLYLYTVCNHGCAVGISRAPRLGGSLLRFPGGRRRRSRGRGSARSSRSRREVRVAGGRRGAYPCRGSRLPDSEALSG